MKTSLKYVILISYFNVKNCPNLNFSFLVINFLFIIFFQWLILHLEQTNTSASLPTVVLFIKLHAGNSTRKLIGRVKKVPFKDKYLLKATSVTMNFKFKGSNFSFHLSPWIWLQRASYSDLPCTRFYAAT